MPIYEYACRACGAAFETLVRSETVPACPQCRSTQLDKQLSVFATAAAGSGAAALAPAAAMAGPCGTCGHSQGPGSCAVH
jgi:putative FmdB family regulatory protein